MSQNELSPNTISKYFQQCEEHMNELTTRMSLVTQEMIDMKKEKEQSSQMEIDEDYISEENTDIIKMTIRAYGENAQAYISRLNQKEPDLYDSEKESTKVFLKKLENVFELLPLVFVSDREKIGYLYNRSPENLKEKIKESVKKPGPHRTFKNIYNQVYSKEQFSTWLTQLHAVMDQALKLEVNTKEYRHWFEELDNETRFKMHLFMVHPFAIRKELLRNNYETGDYDKSISTTKEKFRYGNSRRYEKHNGRIFSNSKPLNKRFPSKDEFKKSENDKPKYKKSE
nr:TPA_inf: Gag [Schizosaccharomyces cryophilus]